MISGSSKIAPKMVQPRMAREEPRAQEVPRWPLNGATQEPERDQEPKRLQDGPKSGATQELERSQEAPR